MKLERVKDQYYGTQNILVGKDMNVLAHPHMCICAQARNERMCSIFCNIHTSFSYSFDDRLKVIRENPLKLTGNKQKPQKR